MYPVLICVSTTKGFLILVTVNSYSVPAKSAVVKNPVMVIVFADAEVTQEVAS